MIKKPTITKLKNLAVLLERPWFGSMFANVIKPFVLGEVTLRNLSNIDIKYNDEDFVIRVDKLIMRDNAIRFDDTHEKRLADTKDALVETVTQFKTLYGRFIPAGEKLYIELTDSETIEEALGKTNSFVKDGVNVIAIKRESGMVYKTPCEGKTLEFTEPEALFVYLGSLANVFMMNRGQPDPRWYKENVRDDFPF